MESTVTEIHEYPLRPGGYEEPLFGAADKDREVMKHFLQVPWLDRASEYAVQTTGYFSGSGRCGWWKEGGGLDFVVYRVELSCGAAVDLAHDRSGDRLGRNEDAEETDSCEPGVERWLLVGMMD